MESKAKLIGISNDWREGGYQIAFHIDHYAEQEDLNGDLRLTVRKWREKRSLSANSYYWVLISAMAEAVDTTREELHEEILRRYSKPFEDDDGLIVATLPNRIDINKISGHWRKWKTNGQHTAYIMLKGSSDMDSKEMSYLIDRVVEEAEELGIETLTPNELERLEGYEKFSSR